MQNTVVFEGNSLTNRIINSVVRGNFVVSPGFSRPDQQSAGLLVRGVAPGLAGTEVVFQASGGNERGWVAGWWVGGCCAGCEMLGRG